MKTVRFDTPWYRNGEVVYPAGVDLPADGYNEQLIADGVAGTVSDVEPVHVDAAAADTPAVPVADVPAADTAVQPPADPEPSATPAA